MPGYCTYRERMRGRGGYSFRGEVMVSRGEDKVIYGLYGLYGLYLKFEFV